MTVRAHSLRCRIRRVLRRIFRQLGGISPQVTGGVLLWLLVLMMAAWLWYLFRECPASKSDISKFHG